MGSKEKNKAEILEENKKLAELVSALKKEVNILQNGGNELTLKFKFSCTKWSREYFEELNKKTKFLTRRYVIDDTQPFGRTKTYGEFREWPDGNRVLIEYGSLGNQFIPYKITFYDVHKGKPAMEE